MKRREIFRWLKTKKITQYSFYKKSIVRRTKKYAGPQNGGIQLYLVASPVLAQECAYSLTIIFPSTSLKLSQIQKVDL